MDNVQIVYIYDKTEYNHETAAKGKNRIRLKTTVILALIALFSLLTATFAWFTLNSFSAVDSLEMTIGTGAELKVSTTNNGTDLSRYVSNITNEMINNHLKEYNTTLSQMRLDPVTTANGTKFYSQSGAQKTENVGGFLEFDMYFIATKDMWVHLTSDNTDTGKNDGTSVTTTATGNASKITQAMRVSFNQENSTRIYEPNKGSAVAGQSTFDIPKPMNYSEGTRLFKLQQMTPTKVTIRVWVEGEDPQCNNDIQNTQVSVSLCFMGTDDNNEAIG